MKGSCPLILSLLVLLYQSSSTTAQDGRRIARQSTNADQMVQNILHWIQGVYSQNSRRIRQGTLREYLPPSNTQRPRPFQPASTPEPDSSNDINSFVPGGYPPAGSITPQPPFPPYPSQPQQTGRPELQPPNEQPSFNGYQTEKPQPSFSEGTTTEGSSGTTLGGATGGGSTAGFTTPGTTFGGYTSTKPGTAFTSGYTTPGASSGFTTTAAPQRPTTTGYTYKPAGTTGYTYKPAGTTGYTYRPAGTTQGPQTVVTTTLAPSGPTAEGSTSPAITSAPAGSTQAATTEELYTSPPGSAAPSNEAPVTEENVTPPSTEAVSVEDDLRHPPHIHAIDVQCAKDMMTINIEFNRQFDGIIYSKGFYSKPDCRYVNENSGQTKYSFTVRLDSCGTEFVNAFDTQGQSYLENVLVLQNEPGIQEVWDTIRAVRCLWEGNLNQALTVSLSVDMLTQEIVTFSGDTAMAKLDIQVGRGPFAKPANGLVKIGETLTLVVSVTGDPGFDIQVKQCKAKDSTGANEVDLTDDDGCVLKPKLFGAFQKTRNTGDTGASVIAYSFFNAFKFPDVMDIMIECNIELCKTDCEMCPDPNQKIDPLRRRRRAIGNDTLVDPVTMGRLLKVIFPEEITEEETSLLKVHERDTLCMTVQGFVISALFFVSLLTASFSFSAYMYTKNQRLRISGKC